MIQIDKTLLANLLAKAASCDRKRISYDLRTSPDDGGQRMLNAMLPGTIVPIHRHPMSNENVLCLCGKIIEVQFEEVDIDSEVPIDMETQYVHNGKCLRESARYIIDSSAGNFGCVVPAGVWHTVEVLEPSVIYEAKDGKYGEDGSETFDEYKANRIQQEATTESTTFSNTRCNLKQSIEYLIDMERRSGSMEVITPLYVSRMLNVPLADVEKEMKDMNL